MDRFPYDSYTISTIYDSNTVRYPDMVVSLDLQLFSASTFKTENTFSLAFAKAFTGSWNENKISSSGEIYKKLDLLNKAVLEKREGLSQLRGYY